MTFLYPTEGEKTKPLRLEATGRGPAVWVPPTAPRAESIAISAGEPLQCPGGEALL